MFGTHEISRLRTQIMHKHPFFGSLVMRLRWETDAKVGTACTDGTAIKYSAKFMAALSPAQQRGVAVHEVAHCMLGHVYRRNARDPRLWNEACDYAINPMLIEAGLELPQGCLIDTARFPTGTSADAIYAVLVREKHQQQNQQEEQKNDDAGNGESGEDTGSGGGSGEGANGPDDQNQATDAGEPTDGAGSGGTSGGSEDGEGIGLGNQGAGVTGYFIDGRTELGAMTEQAWQLATEQAAVVAKAAGTLPGGWYEEIQASRVPKLDPWAVLEQFVVRVMQSDYSWSTPNRRLIGRKMYLPGMQKENAGEMVIFIDTSGSFTADMLTDSASHIVGIAQSYKPEKLHVVFCDYNVTETVTYEPDQYADITFSCKGRGGTRFQPAFDWVEEQGITPVCAIYFTDLEGPVPTEPAYPVLWAVPIGCTMSEGPFGETVRIEVV